MPITLTITEGALSPEGEQQAFAGLTDALLKSAGLSGNAFMTPNVVGTLNVLPRAHVFSGGRPATAAFVELKLPGIALVTQEAKQAFTEAATDVVVEASAGRVARDHVWTNIVYAAEGSWGIAGRAYSDADLAVAIQRSGQR